MKETIAMTSPPPEDDPAAIEATAEVVIDETPHPREGVTAGYDPAADRWHVEIHRPGREVEIIGIAAPLLADEETARSLAEQTAEHRRLPHIEDNRGLYPAETVLQQVRAAVGLPGEDDSTLVNEIAGLRAAEAAAVDAGWTRVTAPAKVVDETPSHIQYDAAGIPVTSLTDGNVMIRFDQSTLPDLALIASPGCAIVVFPPEHARTMGAAMVAAAKTAEDLSQLADARTAGQVTDIPPTGA